MPAQLSDVIDRQSKGQDHQWRHVHEAAMAETAAEIPGFLGAIDQAIAKDHHDADGIDRSFFAEPAKADQQNREGVIGE